MVDTDPAAQAQVEALPRAALSAYAEVRVVLETAPWNGDPYHRANPDGAVRVHTFGHYGQVVYLVLESQRRVDVLMVQWVG